MRSFKSIAADLWRRSPRQTARVLRAAVCEPLEVRRLLSYAGTVLYPINQPSSLYSVSVAGFYDAVAAGQVVGLGNGFDQETGDEFQHALLWTDGAESPTDLNPTGFTLSTALGTDGTQQVGYGYGPETSDVPHALLWSGTAASVVDLNPTLLEGIDSSQAFATSGNQQVGYAEGNNGNAAILWTGTAASAVDLNPPGYSSSQAFATNGTQQVGIGQGGGHSGALLWSGTAASAVELNANDLSIIDSEAYGISPSGNQEVGGGQPVGTNTGHALLWTGTAASAVDLNPTDLPGITGSTAYGTNGGQQVGNGIGDGNERAILWSGTAASAVDLQLDLPSAGTWTSSTAYTIDAAGNVFGVATGTYKGVTGEFAAEWSPVDQASAITSSPREIFTTGANDAFTVTTSGSPTAALTEVGALPTGLTFTDNGNGTATIAGIPAPYAVGKYSITLGASNGIGSPASQSFTLIVKQSLAPTFTSASTATFTTGTAGSLVVATVGVPSATVTESGDLPPPGVAFVNNGDGTATLLGTPADGTGGTYVLALKAKNGTKPNAKQSFTLTVDQAPAITSADTTTFTVGIAGKFTVTTTGFPTVTIKEIGALPAGVTFTDKGNGKAKLRGTPAVGTDGSYPITIRAKNGVKPRASQSFTLVVNSSPILAGANVLSAASALDANGIADPSIDGIILSSAGDDTIASI